MLYDTKKNIFVGTSQINIVCLKGYNPELEVTDTWKRGIDPIRDGVNGKY